MDRAQRHGWRPYGPGLAEVPDEHLTRAVEVASQDVLRGMFVKANSNVNELLANKEDAPAVAGKLVKLEEDHMVGRNQLREYFYNPANNIDPIEAAAELRAFDAEYQAKKLQIQSEYPLLSMMSHRERFDVANGRGDALLDQYGADAKRSIADLQAQVDAGTLTPFGNDRLLGAVAQQLQFDPNDPRYAEILAKHNDAKNSRALQDLLLTLAGSTLGIAAILYPPEAPVAVGAAAVVGGALSMAEFGLQLSDYQADSKLWKAGQGGDQKFIGNEQMANREIWLAISAMGVVLDAAAVGIAAKKLAKSGSLTTALDGLAPPTALRKHGEYRSGALGGAYAEMAQEFDALPASRRSLIGPTKSIDGHPESAGNASVEIFADGTISHAFREDNTVVSHISEGQHVLDYLQGRHEAEFAKLKGVTPETYAKLQDPVEKMALHHAKATIEYHGQQRTIERFISALDDAKTPDERVFIESAIAELSASQAQMADQLAALDAVKRGELDVDALDFLGDAPSLQHPKAKTEVQEDLARTYPDAASKAKLHTELQANVHGQPLDDVRGTLDSLGVRVVEGQNGKYLARTDGTTGIVPGMYIDDAGKVVLGDRSREVYEVAAGATSKQLATELRDHSVSWNSYEEMLQRMEHQRLVDHYSRQGVPIPSEAALAAEARASVSASLDDVMSEVAGGTTTSKAVKIDRVRHAAKRAFRERLLKTMVGDAKSEADAIGRFRDLTDGINSSDMGNLGEHFYEALTKKYGMIGGNGDLISHPMYKDRTGKTRYPDFVSGRMMLDVKATGSGFRGHDTSQIGEMLALAEQKNGQVWKDGQRLTAPEIGRVVMMKPEDVFLKNGKLDKGGKTLEQLEKWFQDHGDRLEVELMTKNGRVVATNVKELRRALGELQ